MKRRGGSPTSGAEERRGVEGYGSRHGWGPLSGLPAVHVRRTTHGSRGDPRRDDVEGSRSVSWDPPVRSRGEVSTCPTPGLSSSPTGYSVSSFPTRLTGVPDTQMDDGEGITWVGPGVEVVVSREGLIVKKNGGGLVPFPRRLVLSVGRETKGVRHTGVD